MCVLTKPAIENKSNGTDIAKHNNNFFRHCLMVWYILAAVGCIIYSSGPMDNSNLAGWPGKSRARAMLKEI